MSYAKLVRASSDRCRLYVCMSASLCVGVNRITILHASPTPSIGGCAAYTPLSAASRCVNITARRIIWDRKERCVVERSTYNFLRCPASHQNYGAPHHLRS